VSSFNEVVFGEVHRRQVVVEAKVRAGHRLGLDGVVAHALRPVEKAFVQPLDRVAPEGEVTEGDEERRIVVRAELDPTAPRIA